jgi:hypothetical protein
VKPRAIGCALGLLGVLSCQAEDVLLVEIARDAGMGGGAGQGGTGGVPNIDGQSGTGARGGTGAQSGTGGLGDDSGAGNDSSNDSGYIECALDTDCLPDERCEKADCSAPRGFCEPRPFCISPEEPDPVCGCDNVTYWNDCLRRRAGATPAHPGECGHGFVRCFTGNDCGVSGARCARLFPPGLCPPPGPGRCWVLPPICPPSADPRRWLGCSAPGAMPAPPCVDACNAIRSEWPHVEVDPGACQ